MKTTLPQVSPGTWLTSFQRSLCLLLHSAAEITSRLRHQRSSSRARLRHLPEISSFTNPMRDSQLIVVSMQHTVSVAIVPSRVNTGEALALPRRGHHLAGSPALPGAPAAVERAHGVQAPRSGRMRSTACARAASSATACGAAARSSRTAPFRRTSLQVQFQPGDISPAGIRCPPPRTRPAGTAGAG